MPSLDLLTSTAKPLPTPASSPAYAYSPTSGGVPGQGGVDLAGSSGVTPDPFAGAQASGSVAYSSDPILTLGPFSAPVDSFIGALFQDAAGISHNFATGVNAIVNAPQAVAKIQSGQPLQPGDIAALQAATGPGAPPVSFGQALGAIGSEGVTAVTGAATGAAAAVASVGGGVLSGLGIDPTLLLLLAGGVLLFVLAK